MRAKFTHFAFMLALLGPWALRPARAQTTYVPVTVTGYTADVIAENTPVASYTNNTVDRGIPTVKWCFANSNFPGLSASNALPASGTINSITTPGLTFQLAPFNVNNSLRIDGNNVASPATLVLTNPQPCSEVMVLAAEGNGTTAADKIFRVNFTDGTSQTFNNVIVPDWFNGTITPAINVGSRVSYVTNAIDFTPGNPRLYEVRLNLSVANYTKSVQSLTVIKSVADPVLNVMGISLGSNCLGVPNGGTAVTTKPSVCPGETVALGLTGATVSGSITYQWQQSTGTGTGTFTDIPGATAAFYTAQPTVTTQYRAVLTCRLQSGNSTPVTVTVLPATATVAYSPGPICLPAPGSALTAAPATFTPAGGTFSSTAGLALNASTGVINLGASTPGTYTVTYSLLNACQAVGSTSVTLVRTAPTLAYGAPTYCRTGSSGAPTFTPAGGTFSSTAGLALNPSTGVIDLAASTAGTYTVSYLIGGACSASATASLVVKSDALPIFPNVITPNNDQQNDELVLKTSDATGTRIIADVTGYHMQVYSRWGRKVYEGYDATKGWNAADNSAGMYYYQVSYTDCTGRLREYKSWVEVVK
ncbi:T9SS type B sorting domain-containing protein [Hymenobacter ruricola]|uniref:Gliding motility-associated C-terminal domain-containing protein n=1 Tax=Hymenobacter ruricola TaxID=2791023 RepID=A0ABS0HY28_9BACT|nr:gliding motility-associated C-terminal domain-containing protein [Hymenobacter ruricola]MBF9219609.1 gliding motility-associated C-terminal domain-containing protein [Hymenobacter ruricola]